MATKRLLGQIGHAAIELARAHAADIWRKAAHAAFDLDEEVKRLRRELAVAEARQHELEAMLSDAAAQMPVERAREITAACVRAASYRIYGGGTEQEAPKLPDCSLADMLEANAIMAGPAGKTQTEIGYTLTCVLDPRMTAALYALEHYDNDPLALLEALGYEARPHTDEQARA